MMTMMMTQPSLSFDSSNGTTATAIGPDNWNIDSLLGSLRTEAVQQRNIIDNAFRYGISLEEEE